MSLGEKISSLRKRKGISQELLAENAKVSLRTIQRIEGGQSIPRPYTLKVIAEALQIPIEQLSEDDLGNSNSHSMDLERLRLMNLYGLTAFIFPFLNIILPIVVWRKHRNLTLVNALGRRIISFQILWTLGTLLALILTRILQVGITGLVAIGRFPPTIFIVYIVLLTVNFFFVVREANRLRKAPSSIYFSVPVLF